MPTNDVLLNTVRKYAREIDAKLAEFDKDSNNICDKPSNICANAGFVVKV